MTDKKFNPAIVIPVYDHDLHLKEMVESLVAKFGHVVLVDDASHEHCASVLDDIARTVSGTTLVRHATNLGKGGAVITGLEKARELGFTHALQIDADGQHDAGAVGRFLEVAEKNPAAFVCGYPVYDRTVPKIRLYMRELTNFWVHVNSCSMAIRDAMCGFRVYPLESVCPILEKENLGLRMDFDPEIAVHIARKGVAIINMPVSVTYPVDGVSHFKGFRDNVLISKMHTKLFFTMLLNIVSILKAKNSSANSK